MAQQTINIGVVAAPSSGKDNLGSAFNKVNANFTEVYTRRESLTAARTYYVRTDGSDSNTGLADNAGGAFLTVQKAIDVVAALDTSIYQVTIYVRAGTFAGANLKQPVGALAPILEGDTTTPANVVLTASSAVVVNAVGATINWAVKGFKLSGSTPTYCVQAAVGAHLELNNISYDAASFAHITVTRGAEVRTTGAQNILASAPMHFYVLSGGSVRQSNASTTLSGGVAFSTAYASLSLLSLFNTALGTVTGTATGKRYDVTLNSVLALNGATLPGDVAGTTATGGQAV